MTDKDALRNVLTIYKGLGTEAYTKFRELGYEPEEAMNQALLLNFPFMSSIEYRRLLNKED